MPDYAGRIWGQQPQAVQQPLAPPIDPNDPRIAAIRQQPGLGNFNPNMYGGSNANGGAGLDLALAQQYANDPNGYLAANSREINLSTGGWNQIHDPSKYWLGDDPNYANDQAKRQQFAAQVFAQRGNQYAAGVNPMMQGLGTQAGALAGYGNQLGALAGQRGEGQGLAGQAGQGLLALGQMPAGPSAAELAMRSTADQSAANQAAMAAGVRGGNAGLALQAAGANQAQIAGQLGQQIGVQRAQEDMANRTFAANALGQAANVFGGQNALQGNLYGQAGNLAQGAGSLYGTGAQTYGNLAQGQEASAMGRESLGYQVQQAQLGANQNFDTQRVNTNLQHYGISKNAANQPSTAQLIAGNAIQAAGTIGGAAVGTMAGGPAGTVAGATAGSAIGSEGSALVKSDIRAKKAIAPAASDLSDAYRVAPPVQPTALVYQGGEMVPAMDAFRAAHFVPGSAVDPGSLARFRAAHVDESTRPVVVMGPRVATVMSDEREKKNVTPAFATYALGHGSPRDQKAWFEAGMPSAPAPAGKGRLQEILGAPTLASVQARPTLGAGHAALIAGAAQMYPEAFGEPQAEAAPDGSYTYENVYHGTPGYSYDNVFRNAPAYSYEYKDPSAPGASPGTHFGPMAQDLEKTPAGASAVGTDPKTGRKFIDAGRATLLNMGELSNQRREIDALKQKLDAVQGYSLGALWQQTAYPELR